MKKGLLLVVFALSLSLTSCADQEYYSELESENKQLKHEMKDLKYEYSSAIDYIHELESKNKEQIAEYNNLQVEYETLLTEYQRSLYKNK